MFPLKVKTSFLNPSHLPQYLVYGILSLGAFLGGTVTGWSSTALPSIQSSRHFPGLSTTDLSWIASIATLGSLAGSPTGGYLIGKFGRKITLFISAIPYAIGYVALTFPNEIWMLYVGRFLAGAGFGLMVLAGIIYLSEISSPELRGRLCVIWCVVFRIGSIFEYVVGSVLPYNHLSAVSSLLSVAFGVSIFFIPESPRWLVFQNRRNDAIETLCWLQGCEKSSPTQNILDEIEEIQAAALKAEKESQELKLSSYTKRNVLNALLIATILMIITDTCGGNTFSYYAVQIFELTGSPFSSHASGVVIGLAQLGGILFTAVYVDKFGRRILLLAAFIIMTISLAILALFQQFKAEMVNFSQNSEWIPLISFVLYHWAYSEGPYALTYTVSSEVIPTNVIGSVSGLVTAIGWISAFIFTRSFHDMIDGIGVANSFLVFTAFSGIGAICIQIFVPETVGRSLEVIHKENGSYRQKLDVDVENNVS